MNQADQLTVLDVLRELEWTGTARGATNGLHREAYQRGACRHCGGVEPYNPDPSAHHDIHPWLFWPRDMIGHRPGCKVAAALVLLAGDTP